MPSTRQIPKHLPNNNDALPDRAAAIPQDARLSRAPRLVETGALDNAYRGSSVPVIFNINIVLSIRTAVPPIVVQ